MFCKKEKPAGFSFLLFHEKGRKEKLLQLYFVRQPFPFLSPFGDIFPRPGEVFPQRESPWHKDEVCMDCQSLSLWERWHCVSNDGEGEAVNIYAFSLRNFSMKSTSLSTPSAGMAL